MEFDIDTIEANQREIADCLTEMILDAFSNDKPVEMAKEAIRAGHLPFDLDVYDDQLGCGGFGCAYPIFHAHFTLPFPNLTLKITFSHEEASGWASVMAVGDGPGRPKVYDVRAFPVVKSNEDDVYTEYLYLVLRSDARPLDELEEEDYEKSFSLLNRVSYAASGMRATPTGKPLGSYDEEVMRLHKHKPTQGIAEFFLEFEEEYGERVLDVMGDNIGIDVRKGLVALDFEPFHATGVEIEEC